MMNSILTRARAEIARAIRNFKFERTPTGIFLPAARLNVGGVFRVWTGDQRPEDAMVCPNLVTLEGRNYNLNSSMRGASQTTAWFIALYENDLAPVAGLTGANWVGTQGEFTNYTETTRRPWTTNGASSAGLLSNSASPAVFTFDTGGGTVFGAALVSVSTKEAVTGLCFAVAPFSESKAPGAGGLLNVQYDLEANDADE
jgi:hypothetical protein